MQRFIKIFVVILIITGTGFLLRHYFSLLFTEPAAAQTQNTDWSQLQYDAQRTGHVAYDLIQPLQVKWKWINGNKWDGVTVPAKFTVEIPVLAQVVTGDNKVYFGSYQGIFYGVDSATGNTLWSYPTGGPIMHTAAYASQIVYFGSADGNFYAINTSDGSLAWAYPTGPIYSAPLFVNNQVCIGSTSGYYYCFSQAGDLTFRYSVGAPIYNSAAASPDGSKIYFAGEDMIPRCLLSATTNSNGTVCSGWNPFTLPGDSLFHYWPVTALDKVIFTVKPQHPSTIDLFTNTDAFFSSLSASDWPTVEPALTTHYQQNPYFQTFFVLNGSSGTKTFDTAMSHIAYHNDALVPPTIGSDNQAYLFYRGKTTSMGGSFGTNYAPDLGKVNLTTGKITPLGQVGEFGSMPNNDLDDNSAFVSGNSVIYATHNRRCVASIDLTARRTFNAVQVVSNMQSGHCGGSSFPFFFNSTGEPGSNTSYPDIAGYDNRGEGLMSPSISGNSMYVVFRGGAVMAVTGTIR